MKIANGVEMLEIQAEGLRGRTYLNPTLVWDEETAILIDCGMPGMGGDIEAAISEAGVSFDKLQTLILTHQDLDHIGSASEVLRHASGAIEVCAHDLDKPYIEGSLPLIKTTPDKMAKVLEALPEEMRRKELEKFSNPPKVKVDKILRDGEELPYCGGIQIIHTPGHTDGHLSLYLKASKTLVAADAMIIWEGVLRGPVQQNTLDMDTAIRSLEKFLAFDIESVICYHGGLWRGDVKRRLHEILEQAAKEI